MPRTSVATTTRGPALALPWWAHQGFEYLVALLFISQAAHADADRPTIGAFGASIALLAALTDGPLGIARWMSVSMHRAGDFAVAVLLIIAPVIAGMASVLGIAICEGAGLTLIWLTLHTAAPSRTRRRPVEPTRARRPVQSLAGGRPRPHPAYDAGRLLRKVHAQAPHQIGRLIGQYRAGRRTPGT